MYYTYSNHTLPTVYCVCSTMYTFTSHHAAEIPTVRNEAYCCAVNDSGGWKTEDMTFPPPLNTKYTGQTAISVLQTSWMICDFDGCLAYVFTALYSLHGSCYSRSPNAMEKTGLLCRPNPWLCLVVPPTILIITASNP